MAVNYYAPFLVLAGARWSNFSFTLDYINMPQNTEPLEISWTNFLGGDFLWDLFSTNWLTYILPKCLKYLLLPAHQIQLHETIKVIDQFDVL